MLSVSFEIADVLRPEDIDSAFATMTSKRVQALLIVGGPLDYFLRKEIADAALKHRLPGIIMARGDVMHSCAEGWILLGRMRLELIAA